MSEALEVYIRNARQRSFSQSIQISLGELIAQIESMELQWGDKDEEKEIEFDFASAIPTTLDSWRGSYSELALGFKLSGYDNDDDHFANITAKDLLTHLKEAIGKEYSGWKGGEYTMNEDTPVWVSNPGNAGNTGVVGVHDSGTTIVILTSYCEY